MDGTGFASSIGSLVETAVTVAKYLQDMKDSPKERGKFICEAWSTIGLLNALKSLVESAESSGDLNQARQLDIPSGPLHQLRVSLEQLQSKLPASDSNTIARLRQRVTWTWDKTEIATILGTMERVKSLITLALTCDEM